MISQALALPALILPSSGSAAFTTLSPSACVDGVRLVVRMALWAVCAVAVGAALVTGLYAGTADSMSGTRDSISIFLGVLMTMWAVSDIGFPAVSVADSVSTILLRSSPVQVIEIVVVGIVIAMASLHPLGSGLYKGLEHQRVNGSLVRLPVPIQGVTEVSAFSGAPDSQLGQYVTSGIAYPALVGHFVAGVVGYWQPSFPIHRMSIAQS